MFGAAAVVAAIAPLMLLIGWTPPKSLRIPPEVDEVSGTVCIGRAGNPQLRNLKLGQTLAHLQGDHSDGFVGFASSFLPPSTKPPKRSDFYPDPCAPPNDNECNSAGVRYGSAFIRWSCMHSPGALMDPCARLDCKPYRTWAEGVPGPGIGETVVFVLKRDRIMIWSGHAKSRRLHQANSRPRQVRVLVLQGQVYGDDGNHGAHNVVVLAEHRVELKDQFGYQPLPLPDYRKSSAYTLQGRRYVALEILSVYAGTQWQDTCMSHAFALHPSSTAVPESAFVGGTGQAVWTGKTD